MRREKKKGKEKEQEKSRERGGGQPHLFLKGTSGSPKHWGLLKVMFMGRWPSQLPRRGLLGAVVCIKFYIMEGQDACGPGMFQEMYGVPHQKEILNVVLRSPY